MKTRKPMDSEKQTHQIPPKTKKLLIGLAFGLVLAVGIAIAVIMTAIVVTRHAKIEAREPIDNRYGEGSGSIPSEVKEKMEQHVNTNDESQFATIARRSRRPESGNKPNPRREPVDCTSNYTNESSYPAARIVGGGNKWKELIGGPLSPRVEGNAPPRQYKQKWECKSVSKNAFVIGGMNFTHSDGKLHVPVCGFYYISGQVFFRVAKRESIIKNQAYVYHTIQIQQNCQPEYNRFTLPLTSHSSVGYSSADDNETRVSTFVADVIKICNGGTVSMVITDSQNLCCPYAQDTFFSVHLVAKTTCGDEN